MTRTHNRKNRYSPFQFISYLFPDILILLNPEFIKFFLKYVITASMFVATIGFTIWLGTAGIPPIAIGFFAFVYSLIVSVIYLHFKG
jgi:hypothetical protein